MNSSYNSTNVLMDFKEDLIKFFDELIEQFPEEGNFVVVRILMKDQVPIEKIMNYFIREILPVKEMVKNRDEKFFTSNNLIFGPTLDKNQSNNFKNLWRSSRLDKEDRKVFWEWFDNFIRKTEKYQKLKAEETSF